MVYTFCGQLPKIAVLVLLKTNRLSSAAGYHATYQSEPKNMSAQFRVAEKADTSIWPLAVLRWALVVIFLWFGCMKFTGYEAHGIEGLIEHSPILGWLHTLFGVQGSSDIVGVLELSTAAALILGAFIPLFSALGAAMSCATYLTTLSFMFSTPGVTAAPLGGFPWLSGDIGQFLLKDLVLLAASVCLLLKSTVFASVRSMESSPL
jgi:reactive chlorine resistance protein C